MKYILGIDIGGTKCAVILGRADCEKTEDIILDKIKFATDVKRGWREIVNELTESAALILSRNGITDPANAVRGIGISCGGPLDSAKGTVNRPPNLPDWDGVPIVKIFRDRFGVPVVLQNDANACAVAEWKLGAGRGMKNMIFLTFGTGMGAGLILDGKLYSGTNDLAGEVGHIRLADDGPEGYGKKGSFEGFCSGGGIAGLGKMLLDKAKKNGVKTVLKENDISAKTIAEAALSGDETAKAVYAECAKRLGQALAIFVDILNPEAIVIGSIFARNEEFFASAVSEIIRAEALPASAAACKVLPAQLGEHIGDFAALGLVM